MEVIVDGIACQYEQAGEGQDVLLLHGWGGEIASFRPLFEALRTKCRVTAIDFAGHGKSGLPPIEGWSVTEYANWTRGVIEALHLAPCDMVAHSFGGRVSILLASTWPELVRKIVLTGAHGIVREKSAKQQRKEGFAKGVKGLLGALPGGDKLVEKLRGYAGSADYRALRAEMRPTFQKVVAQDLTDRLPLIKASTLLIWGREDDATPLWFAELMECEIPDAGLIVYPNCGHFAYLERAAEFNHVVAHFLLGDGEGATA